MIDFFAYRVSLVARILTKSDNGLSFDETEIPLTEAQLTYGLNAIPSAYVQVPVGFDPQTGLASPIHAIYDKLDERPSISILLRLEPSVETQLALGDAAFLGYPKDYAPFVIFDGIITAKSVVRSRDIQASTLRVVLVCTNWLSNLALSSTLSYESHPLNPAQYTHGALLPGNATGAKDWTGITAADNFVTAENIRTDFWGKSIKPFLESVLAGNTLQIAELGMEGKTGNGGGLAALARFQTATSPDPAEFNNFYTGLGMDIGVEPEVAARIAEDLALQVLTPANLAHQTAWDVLVNQLSQLYLFAIVPRVMDAVVVPFSPTIKVPFATLAAGTYRVQQLSQATPRRLRATGILSGTITQTGADGMAGGLPNTKSLGLGGWFEAGETGLIMMHNAPRWMTGLLTPRLHARQASGGGRSVKSDTFNPAAGNHDPARDKVDAVAAKQLKPLLDRYAHAVHCIESLKERQLTVTGVPRFDVAPGSCVLVEGLSSNEIGADGIAVNYYASVLQVSLTFSVNPSQAATSFQLGYFRSETENKQAGISTEKHPVWDAMNFLGCTLVDQIPPPKRK